MTDAEALSYARTALRARAFQAKWDHKPTDRYRDAIEILKQIEGRIVPGSAYAVRNVSEEEAL